MHQPLWFSCVKKAHSIGIFPNVDTFVNVTHRLISSQVCNFARAKKNDIARIRIRLRCDLFLYSLPTTLRQLSAIVFSPCKVLGFGGVHQLPYIGCRERQTATAEFRGVERLEEIVVEMWMTLWKDERLMSLALLVNIAEIRLAVESIVTLACKDKPTAVAAPRMVGVGAVAIDNRQGIDSHCP